MSGNKLIRYSFDWYIMNNGDCNAVVTRYDRDSGNETTFQIEVTEFTTRLYPSSGKHSFKIIPENEHDELLTTAKAFYAGANRKQDFFYWTNLVNEPRVNPFINY